MAKDVITILEENYDLVAALAACFNVDLDVQAEYDDMLEVDVEGADIAEFVAAVNAL